MRAAVPSVLRHCLSGQGRELLSEQFCRIKNVYAVAMGCFRVTTKLKCPYRAQGDVKVCVSSVSCTPPCSATLVAERPRTCLPSPTRMATQGTARLVALRRHVLHGPMSRARAVPSHTHRGTSFARHLLAGLVRLQQVCQLAIIVHGSHDVAAADKFSPNVQLGDGGPLAAGG